MSASTRPSVTIKEPSGKVRHLRPDRKVIGEMLADFLHHFGVVGSFSGSLDVQRDKHAGVAVTWVGVKNRRPNIRVRPPTGSLEWTVSLGGGHLITEGQIREIESCTCSYEEMKHRPPHVHHDPYPLEKLVASMGGAVIAATMLVPSGFVTAGDKSDEFRISGALLIANLADHDIVENLIHTLDEAKVVTAIGTNTNGPSSRVWSYNHTAWLALYDELTRQGKISPKDDARLDTPVIHTAPPPTDPIAEAIQKLDGEIRQEEEKAARLRQEADEAETEIARKEAQVREAETALARLREETTSQIGRLRTRCTEARREAEGTTTTLDKLHAERRRFERIGLVKNQLAEIDLRASGKSLSALDVNDLRMAVELRSQLEQLQA